MDNKTLLKWYCEAGVDEAIDDTRGDWFAAPPKQDPTKPAASEKKEAQPAASRARNILHHTPAAAISTARTAADNCQTLDELKEAVLAFDGCPLKKTAGNTVFADGVPEARVMIIGEAPGSEEDRQGIPFCGPSGKLLDKMLASIELNREESAYISNTVFWRPPGNRQPSQEEMAICLPFVEKHIALVKPKLLILAGGVAAKSLLRTDQSVSRLRGRLTPYSNEYLANPLQTVTIYHPSYLLRTPAQKRLAWHDLLFIKDFLSSTS